ncbi:MAG: sulfoxide reductase heme-binding subunit YedZ [Gammaproteobacteria bacterium]|nr:sulfoxide reductase heme-binding subunit YedZ [Gammaproteobacteria bacterium]
MTGVDRRYRRCYKPLLFIACLVPLGWAVTGVLAGAGVLALPVPGLGADPVRRVLGIFGITTLNLLGLTLAVSPLRVLTGNGHLLRLRRMLGVFAFAYALLHFLVYIGPFQGFSAAAVIEDLTKRPYIMVGFTALTILAALAATSTNGAMRRLRHRWQRLHRLVYVAAACGVWHFWWQVKKDAGEPLLYAAALAVLLGWRVWWRWRRAATSKSVRPTARERTAA